MDAQFQTTNVPYIVPLQALSRADIPLVGAKAANLGELAKQGFPVPDGFTLTTRAFGFFYQGQALDETASPEKVAQRPSYRARSRMRCGSPQSN